MKLIIAYIPPYVVDKLSRALLRAPVSGYTLHEAKGFGDASADETAYQVVRLRLEIAVNDEHVETVKELLLQTLGFPRNGEGLIIVLDIEQAVNIKHGKHDEEALAPRPQPVV